MRRRFVALTLLSLILVTCLSIAAWAADEPTVAVVNGETILRSDFMQTLEQVAGKQILDQMINMRLILQANRKLKLVDPSEVEKQIADIKAGFPTEADFNAALAQNNLTLAQLHDQVEAKAALDKLAVLDAKVTDEEVAAFFEENKGQLGEAEQVHARHILVKSADEAAKVLAELKGGADFGELAKKYSIDEGSKESGGDLGFFGRGEMVKEFEDVAFALKPGEISGPVTSQFGVHIIKVEEHKAAVEPVLADKQAEIRQYLLSQKAKPQDQIIEELRSQADIKTIWPAQE